LGRDGQGAYCPVLNTKALRLQGFFYVGQLQVRRDATTCRSLLARFLARGGPHFAPRGWLVNSRRPIEVQICQMKIVLFGYSG
jgi:hypothetical protein